MKLHYDITRLVQSATDFQQINLFFSRLKRDELTEVKDDDGKWIATQENLVGETFDVLGSLENWCNFFKILGDKYMPDYNDSAIRKLISKIRLSQPVSLDLVNEAEKVLIPQRRLFMSVPKSDFNEAWQKVYNNEKENV